LTLAARRFEIFANLGPQFLDRLGFAHIFRELIIQLGPLLFFDAQNLDRVGNMFPLKLGIRIVSRVGYVKIFVLAHACAAQMFVEGSHRFFAAHVTQHAFGFENFAAARRDSFQLELRVIAVGDGTPFDGNEVRGAVAQFFEALSASASSILTSSISTSRSFILSQLELSSTSNVARNFNGPASAKSTCRFAVW